MADLYDAFILTGPDALEGKIMPEGRDGGTHEIAAPMDPITVQQATAGFLALHDILTVKGTAYRLSRIDSFTGQTQIHFAEFSFTDRRPVATFVLRLTSAEDPERTLNLWIPKDGQFNTTGTIEWQEIGSDIRELSLVSWQDLDSNDGVKIDVTCFATGTLIETADGPRPVHLLQVGDMLRTRDHGLQPLRWLGGRRLSMVDLTANPKLNPIRIAAGALGPGMPARDLTVSPQHRILVRSPIAERMTGSAEVLIAATHLVGHPGIEQVQAPGAIGYWHLMFDRHEIVFAEGAEAESLYLGPMAVATMTDDALRELRALFPDLVGAQGDEPPPTARPVMRGKPVARLIERQVRNLKPLVAALA